MGLEPFLDVGPQVALDGQWPPKRHPLRLHRVPQGVLPRQHALRRPEDEVAGRVRERVAPGEVEAVEVLGSHKRAVPPVILQHHPILRGHGRHVDFVMAAQSGPVSPVQRLQRPAAEAADRQERLGDQRPLPFHALRHGQARVGKVGLVGHLVHRMDGRREQVGLAGVEVVEEHAPVPLPEHVVLRKPVAVVAGVSAKELQEHQVKVPGHVPILGLALGWVRQLEDLLHADAVDDVLVQARGPGLRVVGAKDHADVVAGRGLGAQALEHRAHRGIQEVADQRDAVAGAGHGWARTRHGRRGKMPLCCSAFTPHAIPARRNVAKQDRVWAWTGGPRPDCSSQDDRGLDCARTGVCPAQEQDSAATKPSPRRMTAATAPPARPGPILSIQYLRAVAALAVAGSHVTPALLIGQGGVDVFFVISGFIMWTTTRRPQSIAAFAWNRLLRIVPLYWLATIAMAAHQHADLLAVVKSLLFVPYRGEENQIWPVLVQGWTLNYEMFFYFLVALSLVLPPGRRLTVLLSAMLVLAGVGFLVPSSNPLVATWTNPLLIEFCFGIVLAELRFRNRLPRRLATAWAVAGLALLAVVLAWLGSPVLPTTWRFLLWGVPGALVVAAALSLEAAGTVGRAGVLLLLGDASYAIYLFHTFLLKSTVRLVQAVADSVFIETAAVMAVAAIAGVLVTVFAERPLLAHFRARRPPALAAGRLP